ncbi:MAG: phosphoribosylformylglycinamidine synthase subunit PurL [Actinobacteria bacterium]|nr:MAG: phosphoribosylformylglycinamidine synthase subunit PurL [Actinomycetota bacterium]
MQLYEELGLTKDEYEKITEVLGRVPTKVELVMYSLMWSEHCSYKHSRPVLSMFPTEAPYVLQGPGQNAGVIDIGDGLALAMKVESHNHPSAVEPYQGAATGVGGIVRDIFAMGARPVASLDSLRFGSLAKPRQRYLLDGVVGGIGGYGNCLGVPTVGGEIYFEDAYEGNCLVNAMCIGFMRKDRLTEATAAGVGNHVLLIGSKTGRDGIGGASVLASQEFDERLEEKRPSVQVGDPFTEKLLIEVCLELLEKDLLVALGDCGAAGLTSSASEMASRGGTGMDIHVDRVPLREPDMEPFEIMVSESQERMVAVITEENLGAAQAVCEKWGVLSTVIGSVTGNGRMRIYKDGEMVGDMPARSLAHDSPVYESEWRRPSYLDELHAEDLSGLTPSESLAEDLLALLASPNICSRGWVYEQYDHMVQTNTSVLPGSDAAVLRVKGTNKAIAASVDCNGRHCYLDPYAGGMASVAEAARNVACSGARPLAVTDCLNFGNPEKPEIFYQFREAVRGMADACEALGTPVVSGNVSFYNESFGEAIYPTPTVGMVGLMDDVSKRVTLEPKNSGDTVVLLGRNTAELGGSEYLKVVHGKVAGVPPKVDLALESAVQRTLLVGIEEGLVASAHDCSEGGLAVALAECCISSGMGMQLAIEPEGLSDEELLFGEGHSRVVVTCPPERADALVKLAALHGAPLSVLGTVGGGCLGIDGIIELPVAALSAAWEQALEKHLEG